jgi:hypothetical protein
MRLGVLSTHSEAACPSLGADTNRAPCAGLSKTQTGNLWVGAKKHFVAPLLEPRPNRALFA